MSEIQGTEFSKAQGLPANQEAKARAKAASKAAKEKKEWKFLYTEVVSETGNHKLVKVIAKPNGAQSLFIAKKVKNDGTPGTAKKIQEYEKLKEGFKKQKLFVGSDSFDEKIAELIEQAKG